MPRFKNFIFGTSCLLSLFGCATSKEVNPELVALTELSAGPGTEQLSLTPMRYNALRDTALSVGARAGLAYRAAAINQILSRYERSLERVFNFNSLMLDHSVLPPVLIEGRNTLEQNSPDVLRLADRSYTIYSQARFVTAPPTWRDYLWLQYSKPDLPDRSLLPRDAPESKIWDRYVQQGWRAGADQANTIFAENIGRLKRDLEGMVRYRILLAQHMVSPPFVAKMDLGVTGGGDAMAVNDRMLQITALPQLQSNSATWDSKVSKNKPNVVYPEDNPACANPPCEDNHAESLGVIDLKDEPYPEDLKDI